MTVWIDRKYVNLLSHKLEKFAWKKNDLANFRCPICGDSKTNKVKARGYVFPRKGNMYFKCHNCNSGLTIANLLKKVDPRLYTEYLTESYRETDGRAAKKYEKEVVRTEKPKTGNIIDLPTIMDLVPSHMARQFIYDRKIPTDNWFRLYFATDFKKFVDQLIPNHGKNLVLSENRIIIPFYDRDRNLIAIQGRALDKDAKIRYITIKIDEEAPKIYGLDRHEYNKKSYITEGPFDSMFLPNALAAAGSSLMDTLRFVDPNSTVFIYDNEPRNREIVSQMDKVVDRDLNIFIWPENYQVKDINDAILSGTSASEILHCIDSNTYRGLEAKFRLQSWKKC